MKIFTTQLEIADFVFAEKNLHKTIGFVPTMGALHRGHISLVEQAVSQTDTVVVSIFVNPRQFNDKADYHTYPRNQVADLQLLESHSCHAVFCPEYNELFRSEDSISLNFRNLDKVLEGKFRPGHFQGMIDVVYALFQSVKPHKAFFGMKDYQQLRIISLLASEYFPHIDIIACDVVRESDGLAMSSRNMRLDTHSRSIAPNIYKTLKLAADNYSDKPVAQLLEFMWAQLKLFPQFTVEYVEVCNGNTLQSVSPHDIARGNMLLLAVWCGGVRLIDNIYLK